MVHACLVKSGLLASVGACLLSLTHPIQDLLAICGGRDYVFFLDAAVVERFSQIESLYGYLLEEADLGAEAGGKLRKAILTGFESGVSLLHGSSPLDDAHRRCVVVANAACD